MCIRDRVDGVSLLDRQLAVLRGEPQIDQIVLIGGYMAEMLPRVGVELKTNARYFETNKMCIRDSCSTI